MKELSDRLEVLRRTYDELFSHIPGTEDGRIDRKYKMCELRAEIIQTQKEMKLKMYLNKHRVSTLEELPEDIQTFINLHDEYKAFYENPSTLDENLGELETTLNKINRIRVLREINSINFRRETPVPESTIDELTNLQTQLDLINDYISNDIDKIQMISEQAGWIHKSITSIRESIRENIIN